MTNKVEQKRNLSRGCREWRGVKSLINLLSYKGK